MFRSVLFASIAVALAGCSSMSGPRHECPLVGDGASKCASMEQSYKASQGWKPGMGGQTVFAGTAQPAASASEQVPAVGAKASNFPEPGQTGMPVFQQPKVMRAWVAPYVDADGNLRSGEYVYFSTPGKWNYGATRRSGAASGAFEPGKPDRLGFTPSTPAPAAVPKVPTPVQPTLVQPNVAKPAVQQQTLQPTPATDSVTQPYQRLGN